MIVAACERPRNCDYEEGDSCKYKAGVSGNSETVSGSEEIFNRCVMKCSKEKTDHTSKNARSMQTACSAVSLGL